jgi:NADPH:quinone reductase-like Zn-dependent oxidoreductase
MKAIVQERVRPGGCPAAGGHRRAGYGADDMLVRVHASALNPYDWQMVRGDPLFARLLGVGLTKPKARVAGIDAAGHVEAVGANVRGLRQGFCPSGRVRRVRRRRGGQAGT